MDTLFLTLRVAVSLGAILGLIWYVQRRFGRGGARRSRAEKPVTLVGKQAVSAKASVAVLEMDGKRFLVGVTEHGISMLHTSDTPAVAFGGELEEAEFRLGPTLVPTALPGDQPDPIPSPAAGGSILSLETWKLAAKAMRPTR